MPHGKIEVSGSPPSDLPASAAPLLLPGVCSRLQGNVGCQPQYCALGGRPACPAPTPRCPAPPPLCAGAATARAWHPNGERLIARLLGIPTVAEACFLAPPLTAGHRAAGCGCRERAAQALKGILTVAAVDADAHGELGSDVRASLVAAAAAPRTHTTLLLAACRWRRRRRRSGRSPRRRSPRRRSTPPPASPRALLSACVRAVRRARLPHHQVPLHRPLWQGDRRRL